MRSKELALKKRQLFTDPNEYAFVGVSVSDYTFMGGEYSNESCNTIYLSLSLSNYWHLHPFFYILKLFI